MGFKHRPIELTRLLRYDSRSVPAGGEFFFGLGTQTRPETLSVGAAELSISRMLIPRTHIRNPYIPFFSGKWAYIPFHRNPPPPPGGGVST